MEGVVGRLPSFGRQERARTRRGRFAAPLTVSPSPVAFLLAIALLTVAIKSADAGTCPYPGCPAGFFCTAQNATECSSLRCNIDQTTRLTVCQAPRCDDLLQNGYEAGFDCGGGCKGCDESSGCNVGQDCRNGVCGNSWLDDTIRCRQASCIDKVQSLNEPDIDCGAAACCAEFEDITKCPNLCTIGQRCLTARDCASGKCYRLPRMGGDRFCAGTRPTDIDPTLTARMLTGFRVEGQKRAFFNTTRFQELVAFFLDVPVFSVLVEAVTDVSRPPEFGIGAYQDLVNASRDGGWAGFMGGARRLSSSSGADADDGSSRRNNDGASMMFSEGQLVSTRDWTTEDYWLEHRRALKARGLPDPYTPSSLEDMTAPLQFVQRGLAAQRRLDEEGGGRSGMKQRRKGGERKKASMGLSAQELRRLGALPDRDPTTADYELNVRSENDVDGGSSNSGKGRRTQVNQNFGYPTWDRYYLTTTDTAIAVEVRVSIFVQPFEATLIRSRIEGLVSGMKIHADGWLAERVIARQKFETEWNIDYCSQRVNATTANLTDVTVVDCNFYANKTIWRMKEAELEAAIAAEQAKLAAGGTGNMVTPAAVESGDDILARNAVARRELAGLLAGVPPGGRRLGSGEEIAYAAENGLLFTVGTNYFAIPRLTFNDLLLPITPSYALPPRISLLENVTFDALYDQPNNEMKPYELLVIVQPRGVPERPLWDYFPISIQPVLRLVDRHDRPITSITPNVRVLAGLDKVRYPPEKSDVLLFGDISQSLRKEDGTFRFQRLYFNLNTTATQIQFEASWLGGVDADGAAAYVYLRTQTITFDVLPHPVPPIIIIPRIPLHPVIVALITILCISAVIGSWYYFTKWRTQRMASIKILDVRMIDPKLAKLAALALAQRQAMLGSAHTANERVSTSASRMTTMMDGSTALDLLDPATIHALAEQAKAKQKEDEEGLGGPLTSSTGAMTPYSPGGPRRPNAFGLPDPTAFPYGEDDPLPPAFAVLPPGMRPVAVYTTDGAEQALSIPVKQKALPKEAPSPDKEKPMPVLTTSPGPSMATVVVAIPHANAKIGVPCHVVPMHSLIPSSTANNTTIGGTGISVSSGNISPALLPGQAPSSPGSPSAGGMEIVGFRPGPFSPNFAASPPGAPLPGTAADLAMRRHGPLPKNRNAPPTKIGFSKEAIRADTYEYVGTPKPFGAPATATSGSAARTFTNAAAGLLSAVFRTTTKSSNTAASATTAEDATSASDAATLAANTQANSKKVKPATGSEEETLVDESPRTKGWMRRNHKNTKGNLIEKGGKGEDPMTHLNLALSRMDVRMMALEDDDDAAAAIGDANGILSNNGAAVNNNGSAPLSPGRATSPYSPSRGSLASANLPSRGHSLSPSRGSTR